MAERRGEGGSDGQAAAEGTVRFLTLLKSVLRRRLFAIHVAGRVYKYQGRKAFMNRSVWIVRVLLAVLFLPASGAKIVLPIRSNDKTDVSAGTTIRFPA